MFFATTGNDVDAIVRRYYALKERDSTPRAIDPYPTVGLTCAHCGGVGTKAIAKAKYRRNPELYKPADPRHRHVVCATCELPWEGTAQRDAKAISGRGKKYGSKIGAQRAAEARKCDIADIGRVLDTFARAPRWMWPARAYLLYIASDAAVRDMPAILRHRFPRTPSTTTPRDCGEWINQARAELSKRFASKGLL